MIRIPAKVVAVQWQADPGGGGRGWRLQVSVAEDECDAVGALLAELPHQQHEILLVVED